MIGFSVICGSAHAILDIVADPNYRRILYSCGASSLYSECNSPKIEEISMNRFKPSLGQLASLTLFVIAFAPEQSSAQSGEPSPQITACVEPTTAVANNVSRKLVSTRTDCDPSVALYKAREQSRVNARDAIAPICRDRVTLAEAEATCRSRGLSLPSTATTSLSRPPLAAEGRPAANASYPIQSQSPKLCAVLRNVPNETETTTQPAGVENGFCLFNDNKTTTKTIRTRATCGIQCF